MMPQQQKKADQIPISQEILGTGEVVFGYYLSRYPGVRDWRILPIYLVTFPPGEGARQPTAAASALNPGLLLVEGNFTSYSYWRKLP